MDKQSRFFDEMFDSAGQARQPYARYNDWFQTEDVRHLRRKSEEAEAFFRRIGITFNVYGQQEADERLIPFDVVPRIISAREWARLEDGIAQRVRAINAFLHDIYHRQEILRAGRVPVDLIARNEAFLPQMIGVNPPGGVYTHIVGTDLVRTGENEFYVLEDNARTPSGVSYMLENRETMLQMFPELFTRLKVRPVSSYPQNLRRSLSDCAPPAFDGDKPEVAVLTPGIHNSAYFEHAFLADQMGAELVESHDLRIQGGRVCMRTTRGYKPIDVLYRRIDDDYLDPLNFNPNSLLGVPGIMDVYRAGGITLANAPGTGIADDKALYSYMPDIVEFYTGEKAILQNVPTWRCAEPDSLKYVIDNLADLVVKEVHGSGGYGMLVGPAASKRELARFEKKLRARPANYIAQPTLALSTVPIMTKRGLAPRHVDLRPFVLVSPNKVQITPGGLTRVALKEGSLVVNSSQGGGTKDTWVLGD
ncbi:MAG: circularly permuted type 2 ATP-grasp protein [Alphaproteobacteria bacterium]